MQPEHELVIRFRDAGMPLNGKLVAMLAEDPVHRTERRGCGYTQATRHLAARINQPRDWAGLDDLSLFAGLGNERDRQATVRAMPERLEREESRLLAALIRDMVQPVDAVAEGLVEVPAWPEKLPVGSCPTAEKCFLELAHGFLPRKGRCNVLIDADDRPVLIEKMNMGDDHSCVSLLPVVINGVRLPPGSLVAAHYDERTIEAEPSTGPFRGRRIALASCAGFRMLRLTTLAVSPANRARAFSAHFEAQVAGGLFEPESTELDQLRCMVHPVPA